MSERDDDDARNSALALPDAVDMASSKGQALLVGLDESEPARANVRSRRRRRGNIEWLKSGGVRVTLRGKKPDGADYELRKTLTLGTREQRKADAQRLLEAFRREAAEIEAGIKVLAEHVTLAAWRERALRSSKLGLRQPNRSEDSTWKNMLRPLWSVPIPALDTGRINGWVEQCRRAGYANESIRSAWGILSRLIDAAIGAGVIAKKPWTKPNLPKGVERHDRALTNEEVAKVILACGELDAAEKTDGSLALRVAVQLHSGARPIECARMKPEHIQSLSPGKGLAPIPHLYVDAAKGSKSHSLPVPVELAEAILRHFEELPHRAQALGWLFPKQGKRARWAPRFKELTRKGRTERRAEGWVMQAEIEQVRSRSGVLTWTPYDMRHARATHLASILTDQQLKKAFGWKSSRIVGRYIADGRLELPVAAFSSWHGAKTGDADVGALPAPVLALEVGPRVTVLPTDVGAGEGFGARGTAEGAASPGSAPTPGDWRDGVLELIGEVTVDYGGDAGRWASEQAGHYDETEVSEAARRMLVVVPTLVAPGHASMVTAMAGALLSAVAKFRNPDMGKPAPIRKVSPSPYEGLGESPVYCFTENGNRDAAREVTAGKEERK